MWPARPFAPPRVLPRSRRPTYFLPLVHVAASIGMLARARPLHRRRLACLSMPSHRQPYGSLPRTRATGQSSRTAACAHTLATARLTIILVDAPARALTRARPLHQRQLACLGMPSRRLPRSGLPASRVDGPSYRIAVNASLRLASLRAESYVIHVAAPIGTLTRAGPLHQRWLACLGKPQPRHHPSDAPAAHTAGPPTRAAVWCSCTCNGRLINTRVAAPHEGLPPDRLLQGRRMACLGTSHRRQPHLDRPAAHAADLPSVAPPVPTQS